MDRKEFLSTGAILGAIALAPGCKPEYRPQELLKKEDILLDIPIFCSHEHWGSISSIGQFQGGFITDLRPGALPERRTTILDLLLDPYLTGSLIGYGFNPTKQMVGETVYSLLDLAMSEPVKAYKLLIEPLKNFLLKGTYQSLRLGINLAYGYDIQTFETEQFRRTNNRIGENYMNLFVWHQQMMEMASLSNLIKPVQPEFYTADFTGGPAREELSFTSTVLRIDPFFDFWKEKNSRRDELVNAMGTDPVNAGTWRDFLDKMFTAATEHGCIGIKQLQAYLRPLQFESVKDAEVRFRGDLSSEEIKKFQDWVMHACCEMANERKWPHQIHVGTHNHPHSNPLPLKSVARNYPYQKMVMLHCWPYIDEAGYLAQVYPNVYIDTCWQPILNPDFLRKSLQTWLGYLPLNKITMSNDSTSVEMASGASLITRRVLSDELNILKLSAGLTEPEYREIAAKLLYNNAFEIYGVGSYFQS